MHALHLLASADRRGAEVFGSELADRLDGLGISGDVVALSPAVDPANGLPAPVVEALRKPAELRALRRRARGADVVLGHGSRGLVAGSLVTIGTRTPLVYRSIGDPTFWGASWSRRLRVGLQLRRAARVTALWPGAKDAIARQYGVDPSRIDIVPNAADEQRFAPATPQQRAQARRDLGLDDQQLVVLSVGALSPEKRIDRAVRAVAAAPGATLVAAGDGPDRAAIESLAAEQLPGRHQVLGAVGDVTPLYAAADVVVLLSETEGQPGVAIEAGLCGLPVVATDVGGVSSVVEHLVTGIVVAADPDVGDIARAIELAAEQAAVLGAAAADRCRERFALSTVAEQFAEVLRTAGAGGARS